MLAHTELCCHGISRCDMHRDEAGTLWFHEVNSCPGMTETSDVPHEAPAARRASAGPRGASSTISLKTFARIPA